MEKFAPAPASLTTRMMVAPVGLNDMALHPIDVEQTAIQAAVEEGIYAKLPQKYQTFQGAVRRRNDPIYGLVHASEPM